MNEEHPQIPRRYRRIGHLRPKQIAEFMGVSARQVRYWIADGHIKARRVIPHYTDDEPRKTERRCHVVDLDEFERFLVRWRAGQIGRKG